MNLTFWIQKEGDGDWLPLESPTVEVLEGRYHLMARADQFEYPIDIQIRHRYEEDGILQEELQQRRQQPDTHGNLSLLPTSYLGRGLWTLTCLLPANSAGQGSERQSINLQVLAEDCDLISDWEFMESTQSTGSQEQLARWPMIANPIESSGEWFVPAAEIEAENAECIDVSRFESTRIDEDNAVLADFSIDLGEITQPLFPESQGSNPSYITELDQAYSASDAVRLPVLPAEIRPLQLQRSPGSTLPPDLSKAQTRPEGRPALDLPALPRNTHWHYLPLNKLPIDIHRSRPLAQGSEIKAAFIALELQQRFWRNVHHLMDPVIADTDQRWVGVPQ
jgi:hypothetical protein